MNAAPLAGSLLLGGLIGAGLCWGGFRLAAKSALLNHEERHQADLDRLAMLHRLQLDSVRRGLDIDGAETNEFQRLHDEHLAATRSRVLPIKGRK